MQENEPKKRGVPGGLIRSETQRGRVLNALIEAQGNLSEGWLDGMVFLNVRPAITQFHARIFELQEAGYEIESRVKPGHNWKEYRLKTKITEF